jgi:integrase
MERGHRFAADYTRRQGEDTDTLEAVAAMTAHRESPTKRINPSGKAVWVARYTGPDGKRHLVKPRATFALKRDAQAAIDAAYNAPVVQAAKRSTVGGYFETWTARRPRAERTNRTNEIRIGKVLDVELEDVPLRMWELSGLRRRHMVSLVDVLLREQGRARTGALNVLRSLSAMFEDAITDELADANPCRGVKIRPNDPRIQKARRAVRVWSWGEMHRLCAASPQEPMLRVLSDCGVRLGELLALERRHWHGDTLEIRQTAWEGRVFQGTKTDHGQEGAGRVVPVPPALQALLAGMPRRIDTPFLFPARAGGPWRHTSWMRAVWNPARVASGVDATPHSFRHSYVSLMLAAGVDEADLAEITGHTVMTMRSTYTHALEQSFATVRGAVG